MIPSTSDVNSVSEISIISQNNFYENPTHPLVQGEKIVTYLADPYVVRDEETLLYYMYTTQSEVSTDDSLVQRFTRGPIFESINMIDWTYKGNVFANYTPTWGKTNAGVWAPTVIYLEGYYVYYYSLSVGGDDNPGIGVARSLTPYGPYEHFGKLFSSEEIGVTNSIDPHVFVDDDRVYMVFGSYGGLITLVELASDGLTLKGGVETQFNTKVAIAGYELFELNNYEAALIKKYNNQYYLFLSTGSCCSGDLSTYNVVVAKSDIVTGPYLDSQGRDMFKPRRGDNVVVPSMSGAMGVGHMTIAYDDLDEPWMIYHGYDTKGPKPNWRVIYIDKLLFNAETEMFYIDTMKASNHTNLPGPYINSLEGSHHA